MLFRVRYYAGPYSGVREVDAEDGEQAVAIVRRRIRREMTLPMYSDGYRVVVAEDDADSAKETP